MELTFYRESKNKVEQYGGERTLPCKNFINHLIIAVCRMDIKANVPNKYVENESKNKTKL